MNLDRISNLPADVIQQILSKLSIKEAVRTSVLSRNWKHKCAMLPHLVFDDRCSVSFRKGTITKRKRKTKFSSIVDGVLLLQTVNASIVTFKLAKRHEHVSSRHIDRWILRLSKTAVRKVILEQWKGSLYNVSSSLFLCRDLDRLELYRCLLKIPSTFKGFGRLKSLNIQMATIDQDALEKLIRCCPLLERLLLNDCKGITHLNIDAPNLKYLDVEGVFHGVNIENSLNLVHVAINQLQAITSSFSNLPKFFVQLCHLERLTIGGCFLQCAVDSLQEDPSKPYLCLKSLRLSIRLNNLEEILAAVRLLRSSPALQVLEVSVRQGDEAVLAQGETTYWLNDNQNWEEFTQLRLVKVTGFSGVRTEVEFIKFLLSSSPALQQLEISARQQEAAAVVGKAKLLIDEFQKCTFTQLRVVKLSGISGAESEVGLITFLLVNSPVLEKMTVQPASVGNSLERQLFKKLLQLRRASVQAEIDYLDPLKNVQGNVDSESDSNSDSDSDSDSD